MDPEEDSQQQPAPQTQIAQVVDSSTQSLQGNQGSQPPTPPEQQMYAGFWIRWSAFFIDVWVGIVPSALIAVILVLPIALSSGEPLTKAFDSAPVSILFNGITAILVWFYFIFMTYKYGATLGKMALKLKVTTTDGQPLTLQKVIIREVVGRFLSTILFWIGYLMVAFSKKKQGLHDHLAGTYVIQTNPPTSPMKFIVFLIAIFPIVGAILVIVSAVLIYTGLILLVFSPFSGKSVSVREGKPAFVNRLEQARDASRKSDIAQLAVALRAYNAIHKNYPNNFAEFVSSGDLRNVPTPPPNSEPQDQYGYQTCFSEGTMQAIIYTKLADGNYYAYRTLTGRAVDTASSQVPLCP